MKKRVISGVLIGVVLLVVLTLGGVVLWGTLLVVSLIAFFELTRAFGVGKTDRPLGPTEAVGACGIVGLYIALLLNHSLVAYIVAIMLVVTALFFVYVLSFPRINSGELTAVVFCFLYAPCMLSFIYLLRELPYGSYLAWVPFDAWICDTCAFFAGRAFGKHKMTPLLSPKKTVEGAIGGTVGATITGVIFGIIMAVRTDIGAGAIGVFAVITLLGSIVTQLGDLAASGIKRDHYIKDYGTLIPGHGGIMDRFDSVILVSPVIYFLTLLIFTVNNAL